MPVKGYFLMRFSFERLLDFDRKIAYSKWYFSVADRQRRCAVCLGAHFALLGDYVIFTIFLWCWLYVTIGFLICAKCYCLFALLFVWRIILVAISFCFAKRWDCSSHALRQHFREIAAPKSVYVCAAAARFVAKLFQSIEKWSRQICSESTPSSIFSRCKNTIIPLQQCVLR